MLPAGTRAGMNNASSASLKLLCESVGGTQRSSTQKKWTFDQSRLAFASAAKRSLGELPPEIAIVAPACAVNAPDKRPRMCAAQASAASCALARMRKFGEDVWLMIYRGAIRALVRTPR